MRIRTADPILTMDVLYQLSYAGAPVANSNKKLIGVKAKRRKGRDIQSTYTAAKDAFFLMARVEGRSPNTIELYGLALGRYERQLGRKALEDVTPTDIRRLLFDMTQAGLSPHTIHTYFKELAVFFRFSHEEGLIVVNPMAGLRRPKLPKTYPFVLSEEQAAKLTRPTGMGGQFFQLRNRAMLLMFLDTGLRVSELVGLKLQDMELSGRRVKVMGKGRKERIVFMGKKMCKAMAAYLKVRGYSSRADEVFLTKGGKPLDRRSVLRIVKRIGKTNGLDGVRCSPHTLRHTFATLYIKNGGDAFTLQQLLGHADIKTVLIYVNMAANDIRLAHAKYSPLDCL